MDPIIKARFIGSANCIILFIVEGLRRRDVFTLFIGTLTKKILIQRFHSTNDGELVPWVFWAVQDHLGHSHCHDICNINIWIHSLIEYK